MDIQKLFEKLLEEVEREKGSARTSDSARRWAVLRTELEKAYAYALYAGLRDAEVAETGDQDAGS